MMAIEDSFDRVAGGYASFRPHYPATLFELVAAQCQNRRLAWEVGCGSGQATRELAARFTLVEATDPAPSAIEKAPGIPGVHFSVGRAESCSLGDGTVDLIVSAQAAHWFDMSAFAAEVKRVGAPGSIVAIWTYDRCRVTPDVDAVIDDLYWNTLGGYWDPRRTHVDNLYASLEFPFTELHLDPPDISLAWNMKHLLGYLRTWSAVQAYMDRNNHDPVEGIEGDLLAAWGDPAESRELTFRIGLRAGHVHCQA